MLEFGIKRENEERRDGGCCVVFDPESKKYAVYTHPKGKVFCLFGGGYDEGEDEKTGCLRELLEESGFKNYKHVEKIDTVITHYFNELKGINRFAHASCFLVVLDDLEQEIRKLEEHEDFELVWSTSDEILESWNSNNEDRSYDHWIYFFKKSLEKIKELDFNQ